MIVCTCDHCGKVTENWYTLNINLRENSWKREICYDCYSSIRTSTNNFIDSITVTDPNGENNDE